MDILQSLWGAARQDQRLLRLHTPLGGDTLVAERLDGWEAVDGGGFRFELTALSADAHLPLERLLGAPLLVELLTADSRSSLRPFHGHATAVERVGSNGGLARYRLVIEPWLALLRLRRDSYVFRSATVIDIVEQIFGHYAQGVVTPAWRWALADRSLYLERSLTSQYHESDFDFVQRLLAEEGIFYWFEHAGDPAAPTLGQHTLVLADHNGAFADPLSVRYHRADATEQEDTIQRWAPVRRWQTGQVARASWDYRTLSLRPAQAQAEGPAVDAVDDDIAGPYAWPHATVAERRARQHLDARHVDSAVVEGEGTVRRLAAGTGLILTDHPSQDRAPLVCLRVHHRAHNNLDAETEGALGRLLGAAFAAPDEDADRNAEDFYRNHFQALPIASPYRPRTPAGHGLRSQPRPSADGPQSAIVVGDGAPIHTDRDHRIRVQQHWQRGGDAVSRLDHPRAPNAPANAGAGSWTRVLVPLAGANWGTVMLPRVGQEVWLDYLEGDIDRPVVVAALYNGQGAPDAPGNSVAGGPAQASANAPAWFAGNGHPGVFAGFKSQDLSTSATGQGGYRQLRFDDTPGQGHVALSTTDYASSLVLGHIKHVVDNARQADLGYGAALATEAQGALRAGAGLYATTRPGAAPMDAAAARHALDGQRRLAEDLATLARQQQAALPDESGQTPLPAVAATQALLEDLAGTRTGQAAGQGIGGGEGTAPAWTRPHLLAHGEDGLLALTPQSHVLVSGTDSLLSAGQDLDLTAQGELSLIAAKGIALYTQGTAPATDRPVATTGIALHAATGSLHLQAQQDELRMAAQKAITLASVRGEVNASARQQTLLTAAGAYLKLTPRDIEIGAPGRAEFKAMQRELNGPMTAAFQAETAQSTVEGCGAMLDEAAGSGSLVA